MEEASRTKRVDVQKKMKHQANMKATKKASFLMKRFGEKKYLYLHGMLHIKYNAVQ